MTPLEQLAVRVEAASGADRLLDVNILWAIRPEEFWADAGDDAKHLLPSYCYARGGWRMNRADHHYIDTIPVPRFTESLDAAMTLVPEGGRWFKCGVNAPQTSAAEVRMFVCGPQDESGRFAISGECLTDETPNGDVRALCSAALRARSEQGTKG